MSLKAITINMKIFFKHVIVFFISFYSILGWSNTQVYFAGLSYVGEASNMGVAAPYASSIINNKAALSEYNSLLRSAVAEIDIDGVNISSGLGNSKSGNALSIALAITEEQFQAENTGSGYYAVKATTFGQIVLFDFTEKKVISTIPFITSYTDSPKSVDDAYRRQIYRTVYFDQSKKINLINEFISRLPEVNFDKPFSSWNIKVRSVSQTANATKYLTKYAVDKAVFDTRVASQFSAAMSKRLGIPVLPYTKGQAIGGAMAMRFENADAVQLELPPADYYVDLKLLGFNKKIMKETAKVIYPSFIAGLRVSIGDLGFDELLYSEKAQSGRVLKLSKKLEVNEWNELKNSLTVLSDEFCAQLAKPDKKWFKEKMFSKKSFKKITKISKTLERDIFENLR
jgi:hypothetical protein